MVPTFMWRAHTPTKRDAIALEPNLQTEPLVDVPQLLARNHEHEVSTRDRPARTGADARIEESAANEEYLLRSGPMEGSSASVLTRGPSMGTA